MVWIAHGMKIVARRYVTRATLLATEVVGHRNEAVSDPLRRINYVHARLAPLASVEGYCSSFAGSAW